MSPAPRPPGTSPTHRTATTETTRSTQTPQRGCDEIDEDCDGLVDETGEGETFYLDADNDGYGDPALSESACSPSSGYVDNGEDCDDTDPEVNPGAEGDCSGQDLDCSGWIEEDEAPGSSEDCSGGSCNELLEATDGSLSDGLYWLDPTASGVPFQAWCDMTTDGGGYTFLKVDAPGTTYAENAERACNEYGLGLFIPRTEQHLASAWAVSQSVEAGGEASSDYLYILAIYPDSNGATCKSQALTSDNASCGWSARDGGDFWVTELTTITEPNGDNDTRASMNYSYDADGVVSWYNDTPWPGSGSEHFLCSRGDK